MEASSRVAGLQSRAELPAEIDPVFPEPADSEIPGRVPLFIRSAPRVIAQAFIIWD
jgi:hypothetical protein